MSGEDVRNPRKIIDKAVAANTARLRTTFLARVEAYTVDNGVPLVDVRPIVKGRTNNGGVYERAVLYDLPYCPPAAGPFVVYLPLAVGDVVECGVFERSAEEYFVGGSASYEAVDPRRHDERDAYVRARVRSRTQPLAAAVASATDLVIGFADGTTRIVITSSGAVHVVSGDVRLGSATANAPVALNPNVLAQLQAIAAAVGPLVTWYNAGVTAAVAAGVAVPAQFLPATPPATPYTAALTGAAKVKAE